MEYEIDFPGQVQGYVFCLLLTYLLFVSWFIVNSFVSIIYIYLQNVAEIFYYEQMKDSTVAFMVVSTFIPESSNITLIVVKKKFMAAMNVYISHTIL